MREAALIAIVWQALHLHPLNRILCSSNHSNRPIYHERLNSRRLAPSGPPTDHAPSLSAYSFSFAATLNPNRARPPATMRPIQLSDFGTDQPPIMRGQSSKIRIRWNSATKVKIAPANRENVLRFIERPNLVVRTMRTSYWPASASPP
jgi:hypothetical protein